MKFEWRLQIQMFYLNTIEQLFLFVEQLDQLEVCLPYIRLLTGIPIVVVFKNFRWNSNKTSLHFIWIPSSSCYNLLSTDYFPLTKHNKIENWKSCQFYHCPFPYHGQVGRDLSSLFAATCQPMRQFGKLNSKLKTLQLMARPYIAVNGTYLFKSI